MLVTGLGMGYGNRGKAGPGMDLGIYTKDSPTLYIHVYTHTHAHAHAHGQEKSVGARREDHIWRMSVFFILLFLAFGESGCTYQYMIRALFLIV